jgi:hypothetical protein
LIGERRPGDVVLSLAEQIQIDLAEPREDHRVLKLACRRIAGAGKRQSARVLEREPGVRPRLDSEPHGLHPASGRLPHHDQMR